MHNKCHEILFSLALQGKINYLNDYSFPPKEPLKLRLKDILEDEVDEKYYLSQKMIDGFMSKKGSFSADMFKPLDKSASHTGCLTARYHKMAITDPYIKEESYINQDTQASKVISPDGISTTLNAGTHGYAQGYIKEPQLKQVGNIDQKGHNSLWGRVYDPVGIGATLNVNGGGMGAKTGLYQVKSATKKGYEVATNQDSINFTHPDSKTRRGRVGKGVAQTLDCACNQGVIDVIPTQIGNSTNRGNSAFCLRASEPNGIIEKSKDNFRIRRLTPTECFKLQGLKDEDIDLVVSDTQAYKIAGNAITIQPMMRLIDNTVNPKNYGNLF